MPKRIFEGTIISDKMDNTVVVKVEKIKQHPKYKKRYKVHNKYKAHAVLEGLSVGDKVMIEECRPISKDKTWRVIKKIAQGISNVSDDIGEVEVVAPKVKKEAKIESKEEVKVETTEEKKEKE